MFADSRELLGIERKNGLEALYRVKAQEPRHREHQHGDGVSQPVLIFLLVHSRNRVKRTLDRAQDRRQKCALAIEDGRHVPAEGFGDCDDDRAI